MGQKIKIFLGISYLLILCIFLYFIFSLIEITRLNDFSYYKELQFNLENYIGKNIVINFNVFFLFFLLSGFLF